MNANYNLLTDKLIRATVGDGTKHAFTLPELLGLLARDELVDLIAVRAHQRPVVEEFLTRIAVLACERAGLSALPTDTDKWEAAVRGLTPSSSNDEPWCLVVDDQEQPAFLQPPQPADAPPLKKTVHVPHDLDVLITARQHDVKAGITKPDDPEAWFYALILLQTQSGFLGAGNFGISRMNGGFSNRSLIDLVPFGGGICGAFRRNAQLLLKTLPSMHKQQLFGGRGAIALLWLLPWDGSSSLTTDRLHILFVEVARRVRLSCLSGTLIAHAGSSKKIRVDASAAAGNLGDPWAAVDVESSPVKAMTLGGDGFGYRRIGKLIGAATNDKQKYSLPLLAQDAQGDYDQPMTMRLRGLVRGQGKTEGFHARDV
ncbi:CRISPR-associated protein Cse1, partial [bacterium]|nr:CRISPR-associated protein Cse1 [bacterium]